jgi:ferrochelatase
VASAPIDSVLLIGFGGPTRPEEIRPFLDNVLRGRPVPKERYDEVVKHYEAMGGRSPYNDFTMRQADALRVALGAGGFSIPVEVGMRNWEPLLDHALGALAHRGARHALCFILAAHRSEASWGRYQEAVEKARAALGASAPDLVYPEPWHMHPNFIEAVASRASDAFARLDSSMRAGAHLIFTAHSIPVPMSMASGYAEQIMESSRMVAERIGRRSWTLAFQSRSGSPREPWLEPDIGEALRKSGAKAAVVVPIGFLCDHIEVLYDLDIAAAAIAREAGIAMERAATVGDHPAFIAMIAETVRKRMGE